MRRLMSGLMPDEVDLGGAPVWLNFSWELTENSDHWSFLERRIPVVLLHTGLHRDYHRPSDDAHKINREGMREAGRYLLAALIKTANEERLPAFRRQVTRENESMRRGMEQPLARRSLARWPANEPRPRLGISWRADASEPGAVFLTRVVEGTPADAAGLAVGDRIYELNGQTFEDDAAFQSAVNSLLAASQAEFTMLIERRGHVRTVVISLASAGRQESSVEGQGPERFGS
jgi:predicted metalloprotease with PDZ domain